MKTILFLFVIILVSCEKQHQRQLHHYTVTFTNEYGDVSTIIYKLVERNKDFLIFHSDEWDTLFFDDKTHLHGVLHDWVLMQSHESDFTGEITINKYNRLEINGVAMKHMGYLQPLRKYSISIH